MMAELGRERLAVVGCGLIGASWAALMTAHGHDVTAWDPSDEVRAGLPARVDRLAAQVLDTRGIARGRLVVAPTLAEAVRDASYVQENAPEKVEVKKALYAEIEASAPKDAVIASSTTALVWSELAERLARPKQFITAHPFNPPHLMPLVELFGPEQAVLDRAAVLYRSLGREPVPMRKEAIGHIANRLQAALWREAVNMVAEGIAGVTEIDRALVHGPGLRWSVAGAHLSYHLGGGPGGIEHYLDHLGPSQERRWASLGSPKLTPNVRTQLIAGVHEEVAGRSIDELEALRNAALARVLAARKEGLP